MNSALFTRSLHCKNHIWVIGSLPGCRPLVFSEMESFSTATNIITPENQMPPKEGQHIKPFDDIPGPRSHPILHIAKNFLPVLGKYAPSTRYKYFDEAYFKYGPIIKENLLIGQKVVLLYDPKDIETAFRASGKTPLRPPIESLKAIRESRPDVYKHSGLLLLNGEEWYKLRQKLQIPMLQMKSVEAYCQPMDKVAQDFVNHLHALRDERGEVTKTLKEMYKWALESIGLVVFNTRLGCLEKNLPPDSETMKLVNAVQDTFSLLSTMETGFQIWKWIPTPKYHRVIKAQMIIARMASKYINQTLEHAKNLPEEAEAQVSLLLKLLTAKGTTMEDVIVMINDILLAGVDTTTHTAGMIMYHLARNQRVQDKVAEEIHKVVPPPNTPITPEMLQELRYLRACIKETHRMSPITDGNARILEKDLVLSGYHVPAGTLAVMQHRTIGKYCIEDAEEFKPERWLKSKDADVAASSIHPFSLLPFGYGTRMCVGRRFAVQEILLLLARLLQRYRVEYHYGDIDMLSRFVNVPNKPLRITFLESDSFKV